MQNRLDEALLHRSPVIAKRLGSRCAHPCRQALPVSENHVRAAELFIEVIRDPRCTVGRSLLGESARRSPHSPPQPAGRASSVGALPTAIKSVVGDRARRAILSLKALAAELNSPASIAASIEVSAAPAVSRRSSTGASERRASSDDRGLCPLPRAQDVQGRPNQLGDRSSAARWSWLRRLPATTRSRPSASSRAPSLLCRSSRRR